MTVDYTKMGLAPGVHLYQGSNHLKSISYSDVWGDSVGSVDGDMFTLFSSTPWLYAAIMKRRSYIRQIPKVWALNGEDTDEDTIAGLSLDDVARIDMTIQLYGWCFYHKERTLGGEMNLRYLSPRFIIPDESTANPTGYGAYWYTSDEISAESGKRILEEDLIIFREDGIRESRAMVSAGWASRIQSNIVYGLSETIKSFYDTNGLPVVAVIVPPSTTTEQATDIKNRFQSVFQGMRSRYGNKTIGMKGDIKIEVISFAPKDLAMDSVNKAQIDGILVANEVSPQLILETANRAEKELLQIELLQALNARAQIITRTLSEDEDFVRASGGYEMVFYLRKHEAMQKQNLEMAQAIQELTGQPILTPNEGREWLELPALEEIEDDASTANKDTVLNGAQIAGAIQIVESFANNLLTRDVAVSMMSTFFGIPENISQTLVPQSPQPIVIPSNVQPTDEIEDPEEEEPEEEVKSTGWREEAGQFKRWLKNRTEPDPGAFESTYLTMSDKQLIVDSTKAIGENRRNDFIPPLPDVDDIDPTGDIVKDAERRFNRLFPERKGMLSAATVDKV